MIHKPIDYGHYHRFHARIRSHLNKIAFNQFYACEKCGSHNHLEIHIPDMSLADPLNRGSYQILCHKHHSDIKHLHR